MTDALWNGIIGAGGAAICCAVYFGFKGVVKVVKKYRTKTIKMEEQIPTNTGEKEVEGKKITITIPSKNQIFTKQNFKALMFLIIAGYSIYWAIDLQSYYSTPNFEWMSFEGDYYSYNAEMQRTNIIAIGRLGGLFGEAFFYFFWMIGLVFFTLGITGFSFKKK